MKNWKILAVTAVLGAITATPVSAATVINYNDVTLNTQQPIFTVENRTMVGMRDLFENLEANVSWDDAARLATLNYRDKTVKMYPDTGAVLVNGVPQALDVRPQLINDRIYLPLRFVAQTLGSTVDYTQLPNGDSFIDIHSMDSAENFVTVQGNTTRIVRTAVDPVSSVSATAQQLDNWKNNSTRFFYDDHGNLVELQSVDNKLVAYITDMKNAKCTTVETSAPTVFTVLGDGKMSGTAYQVALNDAPAGPYVGVGTPNFSSPTISLESTNKTVYYLQEGSGTKSVLNFNRSADTMNVESVDVAGYVIDLTGSGVQKASYAKAEDGWYAFLLDDNLMFIDRNGKKVQDTILPSTSQAKIYTNGSRFEVLYVNDAPSYPDLYVTEYDHEKDGEATYRNISQLTKVEQDEKFYPYTRLELVDSLLKDTTLYAFIKTDMDYYVVTYNYASDTSTKLKLSNKERTYIGLIDVLDSVKLISTDNNYYYLRDIR